MRLYFQELEYLLVPAWVIKDVWMWCIVTVITSQRKCWHLKLTLVIFLLFQTWSREIFARGLKRRKMPFVTSTCCAPGVLIWNLSGKKFALCKCSLSDALHRESHCLPLVLPTASSFLSVGENWRDGEGKAKHERCVAVTPPIVALHNLLAIYLFWDGIIGERIHYFDSILSCDRRRAKTFWEKLLSPQSSQI